MRHSSGSSTGEVLEPICCNEVPTQAECERAPQCVVDPDSSLCLTSCAGLDQVACETLTYCNWDDNPMVCRAGDAVGPINCTDD